MPIRGFETPQLVRATLAALRAERRQFEHDKAKVALIDAQIEGFTREDERMRAEETERLAREAERVQRAADAAAGIVP